MLIYPSAVPSQVLLAKIVEPARCVRGVAGLLPVYGNKAALLIEVERERWSLYTANYAFSPPLVF